jgi:hypothetical protein
MHSDKRYSIDLDVRYRPLEVVDLPAIVAGCTDPWYNQSLCRVNDCVVRLGSSTSCQDGSPSISTDGRSN